MPILTWSIQPLVRGLHQNSTRTASPSSCWVMEIIKMKMTYMEETQQNQSKAMFLSRLSRRAKSKKAGCHLKPDFLSPMVNTVTSCIYIIKGIGNVGKHLFCSVVLWYQLAMRATVDNTSKLSKSDVKLNTDPNDNNRGLWKIKNKHDDKIILFYFHNNRIK